MSKKLLFVIGSLGKNSKNRKLAEMIEEYLGEKACVSYLDYTDVPMMNTDIEFPTPEVIVKLRNTFKEADGVWLFVPEYNYDIPGALKNTLDWISRATQKGAPRTTAVSSGIKATYSSVSGGSGGSRVLVRLDELLAKMHMDQMKDGVVGLSDIELEDGKLVLTEEQINAVHTQADNFMAFLN